jgi:hypothetical protein
MNRDTYARFLRSEAYKELLIGGKKKVSNELNLPKDVISFSSKNQKSFDLYFQRCFSTFCWANCTDICIHIEPFRQEGWV